MERSLIKKLTAQLSTCRENNLSDYEMEVVEQYWNAIRKNNDESILSFERFGSDVVRRVKNLSLWKVISNLGFPKFSVNEYGILDQPDILKQEEISLRIASDNNCYNRVIIGQAPNGKWCYGYYYECGTAGGGRGLSVYHTFFNVKEDCIKEGLNVLKAYFLDKSLHTNSNSLKTYCRRILEEITIKLNSSSDFSINKKGQIMLF